MARVIAFPGCDLSPTQSSRRGQRRPQPPSQLLKTCRRLEELSPSYANVLEVIAYGIIEKILNGGWEAGA